MVEEDFEQYEEMEDVSYGVDVRSDNNEVEIIVENESPNVGISRQSRQDQPSIDQQQQSEATSSAASTRELIPFTLHSSAEGGAHMSRQHSQLLLVSLIFVYKVLLNIRNNTDKQSSHSPERRF